MKDNRTIYIILLVIMILMSAYSIFTIYFVEVFGLIYFNTVLDKTIYISIFISGILIICLSSYGEKINIKNNINLWKTMKTSRLIVICCYLMYLAIYILK